MTSRDTEIERIAGVLVPLRAYELAAVLYDAGLRSQPASEPSLDVELWEVFDTAMSVLENNYAPNPTDLPYDAARWDRMREAINAVYYRPDYPRLAARLSQPADNEAAESRTQTDDCDCIGFSVEAGKHPSSWHRTV